ncbi:DNA-binding response regulator [Cytophagales bacterium WSM2-2]|nr:DNA-binding response regulator [Cytophagales bacterium WSM2-2]
MKLKCLIIDDEPIARKIIREFLAKVSYLELCGEAEDPAKASSILENESVDLVFLDIQMPRMTGIQFLQSKKDVPFLTIITTAYPNYAVEGFELNILDYLVKPIAFERFVKACTKAKQYFELKSNSSGEEFFFIKSEGKIEKVEFNDVIYIESLGNYLTLHLTQGKKIVYLTLKSLLEQLPATHFIQVHKSYAINKTKVKSIEGNEIKFEKHAVPIGIRMKDEVMKDILGSRVIRRQ